MSYEQDSDPKRMAFLLQRAYNQREGERRKFPTWQCSNSETNKKAFARAAGLCLDLGLDPGFWVEQAYDWMGDKQVWPQTLASPKFVEWLQKTGATVKEDYNEILRDLGVEIPDGARAVDEYEYELLVGAHTFYEWMERNHGVRHITDEIIDKSLCKSYLDLDPLIVYVCGCYKTRIRELFKDRARARLEESPELKTAMLRLGWQPLGLDV
jgi:hypothetical protein